MMRLLAAIVILYGAIKFAQRCTRSRDGDDPSRAAGLRRGEPWLILAAILVPTILFVGGSWWQQRWATRTFAQATDCIGQLSALERSPAAQAAFGAPSVSDTISGDRWLARDAGARLSLDRARIDAAIDRSRARYAGRFAALLRENSRVKIDAQRDEIDRCLLGEWNA